MNGGSAGPIRRGVIDRAMLLVAALALWSGPALAGADPGLPASWTEAVEPVELFDDVYWVGTRGLGAFLFTSEAGHVLVDVGVPRGAPLVAQAISSLGVDLRDVRVLLNTQAHFDHAGGLAELKALTGARLLASEGDRYALEHGVYEGWESRPLFDFPAVELDGVVTHGQVIRVGDVSLTAHATPGHSPGCTSWSFTARRDGAEHRAMIFCSASVAANRLAPDPQYDGIVEDFRATFAYMRGVEVDVWLTPHAEQFGLWEKLGRRDQAQDPFVDPSERGREMANFEADFEAALARQLAAPKR